MVKVKEYRLTALLSLTLSDLFHGCGAGSTVHLRLIVVAATAAARCVLSWFGRVYMCAHWSLDTPLEYLAGGTI
jgi:hypothetical protein